MNVAPDPTIRRCDMEHFGERVLTEELADAKKLYVYQAMSPWVQIKSAA